MNAFDSAPNLGLIVRSADLARAQPPRWAWEQRIVLGYLNLLLGNEGGGKGTHIAWLLARLTRVRRPRRADRVEVFEQQVADLRARVDALERTG